MSLTNQAYDIIGEWFDSHEGELLAALQEKWPHEYDQAIVTQKNEDPSFDPQNESVNLSVLCNQISAENADNFLNSIRQILKEFEIRWPSFN